jgi:hypothetical protein
MRKWRDLARSVQFQGSQLYVNYRPTGMTP